MLRVMKFRISAFFVLVATVLSVTMLNGQVPAKRRGATKNEASPAVQARIPDAVADPKPLLTAKPGSPEAERLAALAASVRSGQVPLARFGVAPPEDYSKGPRMPDFVGTEIVPQKGAKGEMLAFQQRLSPAFATNDPLPASRVGHFAWLNAHPNVRIFGWYGTVTGAEIQDDSSVIVAIEFHPKTEIKGMRGVVLDFVTEKYHVANGTLNLIDTDAGFNNPAIQVIQSF